MGRSVSIDKIPERIVSFGPSITETLFALGLEEKVVGVSDFCNYPEAANSKAKVGNAFNPSLEKIVELDSDLIFTVEHEQLNAELDTLGVSFMVIDPEDIDGILEDIELVGKITGTEKEAERLVKDMEDSISQVVSLVEDTYPVTPFSNWSWMVSSINFLSTPSLCAISSAGIGNSNSTLT